MKRALIVLLAASMLIAAGCSQNTDQLIEDIQSDSDPVRLRAASKLTLIKKDPEVVDKLIELLDSDNERTILIAAQVLGTTDSTSYAVEPLGKLTKHPNSAIRDYSVQSLGLIGGSKTAPYIIAALADSVPEVRHTAVRMLGYISYPPAVEHLYPMFRDEVDSIRVMTIQSLYMYRRDGVADIRAADFAVPANDQSDVVRYVAAQALGETYPDSTIAGELLIELLSDQNKSVRKEAIISIGKIRYEPAVEPLKQMYDFATLEEELEISETIKRISGEEFPPSEPES